MTLAICTLNFLSLSPNCSLCVLNIIEAVMKRHYKLHYWGINYENEKAYRFMKAFSENKIPNSQIRSHWHKIFSTTQTFKDNKLHLVKTTINHMLQKWMMANFPNLHVWGIWRNPIKILFYINKVIIRF